MGPLDLLLKCAGRWVGTSRLQDPHTGTPDESPSTANIIPMLGGRFVRIDYDWAYHGTQQQGSYLIGHESDAAAITALWVDTWHMADKVMACRGPIDPGGEISVRGTYAAPPGPDWGWRTVIAPGEKGLRLIMYNITPDGHEELAVEAHYSPGSR